MNYYKCGKILTTHGIKGDLKILPMTDFLRFFNGNTLYVLHNNEYIMVKLKDVKEFQGNLYLLKFEGLEDINLVEKYHGDFIYVSELQREKLEDGYYYSELINKDMYNQDNKFIGKVISIEELPAAKYLVVNVNGKRKLVPMIMDTYIKEVLEDKIIVNEIEGLF